MHLKKVTSQFSHGKKAWFLKQNNDPFVRKARELNYRSRASFKLLQIHKKYHILGEKILDLGCAPGSWCEVARNTNPNSLVVGIDLLDMKSIDKVDFYKGDARKQEFHQLLQEKYESFDTIISDMAPNFTGDLGQTHEQLIELNTLCLILALKFGIPRSNLAMKVIQGTSEKSLFSLASSLYRQVHRFKPNASRSESVELYYVCRDLHRQLVKNEKVIDFVRSLDLSEKVQKKELERLLKELILLQ